MIDKYTVNHIVVRSLYEAAQEFKIKRKTLARWGLAIDADFRARNVMNVANTADLAPVVTKLQKELLIVKDQNVELKHMLTEIREHQVCTARDTSEKLSQLLSMITLQDTPINSVGAKRMRLDSSYLPSDTDAAAAAVPVNSSGSESAVLIMSTTPGNAFSMLQQAKDLVHFKCTMSLSHLISKWYEKGFKTTDKPAQWTVEDVREKHCIIKVMQYVEIVWPLEASSVLQACPPSPTSPEYLQWNTTRAAAAITAADAVISAIAAVDTTKVRDKKSINGVYTRLQKNGLLPKTNK